MTDIPDHIRTDVFMHAVARQGCIHLLFSEKDQAGDLRPTMTGNMLLSPSDALTFSALLADLAYEEESGLKAPNAIKEELVQRHRQKLRDRLTVLFNTKRERKTTSNRQLANLVVDVMLHEVFQ